MTYLVVLGLLALNPYLHSITAKPDTSQVLQTILTIMFKIQRIT